MARKEAKAFTEWMLNGRLKRNSGCEAAGFPYVVYSLSLPPHTFRSFERFIVIVNLNQITHSPIGRVWKSRMTPNLMNYVNRKVNEKLADKAVNEAKGWHNKAKTKLWRHLIIPIRNSFVYKNETNMQQHYDEMVAAFDRYCAAASTDQLKADCNADERGTFVKIFGPNIPI